MNIREALNRHQILSISVTAVVLVVVLAALMLSVDRNGRANPDEGAVPEHVWFYDVGDGELFVVAGEEPGPVPAPSGASMGGREPGGVRAHVFACGDCDDPANRFVGYLELVPETHRDTPAHLRTDMHNHVAEPSENGGTPHWVPLASQQGQAIIQSVHQRCGAASPRVCLPSGP